MNLPTLYARTNTGSVQQWTVEVSENSYRTIFGLVNGKLQTTNWTVCQETNSGRSNLRTSEQQANFEALALWKKKKDSGYFENIEHVDSSSLIEPMLAKNYENYKQELTFPLYSQPKLDGIRCIATKDGMFTRNGKTIVSCPHVNDQLRSLFIESPDLIFDGELYNHQLKHDFNKITSLVKKTKPSADDIKESEKLIEYWVYDICDNKKTFDQRIRKIESYFLSGNFNSIKAVATAFPSDPLQLNELYSTYIENGFEGQMIRNNTKYENKRSKNLLKRKDFQDKEYVIIGVLEGEGNKAGMAGAFMLTNESGTKFNSNIKGSREYLIELWNDRINLIGKQATVKYFNLTPGNIPRFPYVISIRDYE